MRIETEKDSLLIGVISDTHVPHRTSKIPDNVIEDLKKRNIDYLFHLGDFTSFAPYQELVRVFGRESFIAVRGNMDFDSELKRILPDKLEIEIFDHKILMIHGMGGPNMILKRLMKKLDLPNSNYDMVIFGHTHRPVNEIFDGICAFVVDKRPKFAAVSHSYLQLILSRKASIDPTSIHADADPIFAFDFMERISSCIHSLLWISDKVANLLCFIA